MRRLKEGSLAEHRSMPRRNPVPFPFTHFSYAYKKQICIHMTTCRCAKMCAYVANFPHISSYLEGKHGGCDGGLVHDPKQILCVEPCGLRER